MSVYEQLSITLIALLATFPGGTLGAAIARGSWWKGAITVVVGVPLSIIFFFFIHGSGSIASLAAGQLLCTVVFLCILGKMLSMHFRHVLGVIIGSLTFGAVAAYASIFYISLQHSASL